MKGKLVVASLLMFGFLLVAGNYVNGQDGSFIVDPTKSHTIHLKYQAFNPAEGEPLLPPELKALSGSSVKLMQVTGPMDSEWLEELERTGLIFLGFIQDFTYIVSMRGSMQKHLLTLPEVAWIGDFHPAYKIQSGLLDDWRPRAVNILAFPELNKGEENKGLMRLVLERGGDILFNDPECSCITAILYPDGILGLASNPTIRWIDRYDPPMAMMSNIRNYTGANFVHGTGFNGSGVVGEVKDAGFDEFHPDFGNLIATHGSIVEDAHGSCTFGIVFSDGSNSASAKGMMPNGDGVFCDWDVARGTSISTLKNSYGGVFQSNSWSQGGLDGDYTSYSSSDDSAVNNNDVMMLYAAGNSNWGVGAETISQDGAAKNVICVGAVFHQNTVTLSDDQWENHGWGSTPSQGPAADDRIKPDLCGPFDSIYTTDSRGSDGYSSGDYTSNFGGTSGATPVVAGAAGLVYEMYFENHFANNPGGSKPHVATVKALLIANAHQYAMNKADRYEQGWGTPDLSQVYNAGINQLIIDGGNPLSTGQDRTYQVTRKDGSTPIKISLVWTDEPGESSSSKALINDLDLIVTDPNSTVYRGNVGLVSNLWSTSGGSSDRKNNVENVFIQSPIAGTYTIEVYAYNVAQDNNPAGGINQDFSLVASEIASGVVIAEFSGNPLTVYEGESVQFTDLSTGDITGWTWTIEDAGGDVFYFSQNPSHTYNTAGTYDVTLDVAGSSGADTEVKTNYITVLALAPPNLVSLDPSSGPDAGGTTVTLSGSNFMSNSTVDFGTSPATQVTLVDTSTITCRTPAHAAGTVNVTITTLGGSDTLPNSFTFFDSSAPEVYSVNPDTGPTAGGTFVTVTGDHFTTSEDTSVVFGVFGASGVTVLNTTSLTCYTPLSLGPGVVGVTVTTTNGFGVLTNGFTYADGPVPEIVSVTPDTGPLLGGTLVTVQGDNFTTSVDTTVIFGVFSGTSVNVQNSTTFTCITPAGITAGAVDVTVVTSNGSDVLTNGFTYYEAPLPEIHSIDPDSGLLAGGTLVTIQGDNFTTSPDTSVIFNIFYATAVNVQNSTTLTCLTPAGAAEGLVDVTVMNSNGSDILADGYTYYEFPPPEIYSVTPASGPLAGGAEVTIAGANFTTSGDTTPIFGVFIGSNVNVLDSATLTCDTPAGISPGSVDVQIMTSYGSDVLVNGYTYLDEPAPVVTDVSPDYGHVLGGDIFLDITITGQNFTTTGDTTVTFGGAVAPNMMVLNSTTITCSIPPHSEGTVPVRVTNSNGFGEKANAFNYLSRPCLYYLGGTPSPGGNVGFEVVAPDMAGEGIYLAANNVLELTYVGGIYDIWIDISLVGYRILYQTITNNGPKLNAQGRLNFITIYPGLGGPVDRFQCVVGHLSNPVLLDVSNYLDF